MRKITIPPHRFSTLKKIWSEIVDIVVNKLKCEIRVNTKRKVLYLRASKEANENAIGKSIDFIKAFFQGFKIADAVALVRLDDIQVESFNIRDVKPLEGDHKSRAVGRISGKEGSVRFAIENATRTRLVISDTKVYIMGTAQNIRKARHGICSLILGTPPGKVFNQLQSIAS